MRIAAVVLAVTLFGCASDRGACLPAPPTPPADCPDGTFADASTNDPICVAATGEPTCRDPLDACLLCTGTNFPDGCRIHGTANECVHRCSSC